MSKIKKVTDYMLFATGDACEFSMAGEPRYMIEGMTPSKHYAGYIKDVDTMRHEFTIAFTDDNGKPVLYRHLADPVRAPIGLPLYFHLSVLLDKETYGKRLNSRKKKVIKYAEKQLELAVAKADQDRELAWAGWDSLENR